MIDKVIEIELQHADRVMTRHVHQWDSGQFIKITDIEIADGTPVDFGNRFTNEGLRAYMIDNQVTIPAPALQQDRDLTGYVVVTDENSETTVKEIFIPVTPRPKPEDYVDEEIRESTEFQYIVQKAAEVEENAASAKESAENAAASAAESAIEAEKSAAAVENAEEIAQNIKATAAEVETNATNAENAADSAADSKTAAEAAKEEAQKAADEAIENNTVIDEKITELNSDKYKESIAEKVPFVKTAEQPEFANSVDECTDTSKLYVLPDGYLYACIKHEEYTPEQTIPNFTDLIPTSIDADGDVFNNGLGYKIGYRLNSSGEEVELEGAICSGFIPVTNDIINALVRIYGSTAKLKSYAGHYIVFYNSDFTKIAVASGGYDYAVYETLSEIDADCKLISYNVSQIPNFDSSTATYMRVSVPEIKDASLFFCSINEEIGFTKIESGMVNKTEWVSTGQAFIPADYEDRIIELEGAVYEQAKTITEQKEQIETLETLRAKYIPDYVSTESEKIADKVLAVRNADSFVMALASDLHTNGTDSSSVGVLHAGQGMNAINSMTQLDLVALLGDYETYGFSYGETDTDGEDARKSFKHVKKAFSDIAQNVPLLQLQGNHDELPTDTTAEARQKYYAYIGANNVGTVTDFNNKFRNYGYRDFDNYKIRVIYLNTADVSDGEITASCYVSNEQLNWLNTVALKLTDTEWGIIVISHHPLNWDGMSDLLTALDDYKNKGNGAELIAHFHGHLHNFRAETLGTSDIPTITIPNACFGRENEYGSYDSYSDEVHAKYGDVDTNGEQRIFTKTADTAEDTAFNVVVIDRQDRKIHCFNYGAGIDREISY